MVDEKTPVQAGKAPDQKAASTPAPATSKAPDRVADKVADKASAEASAEARKQAAEDKDAAHTAADEKYDLAVADADRVATEEKDAADAAYAAHELAERNLASGAKGNAGESTDPAVQKLLAERETARLNRDAAAEAAVNRELGLLGFE